jgi:hypothetical protein
MGKRSGVRSKEKERKKEKNKPTLYDPVISRTILLSWILGVNARVRVRVRMKERSDGRGEGGGGGMVNDATRIFTMSSVKSMRSL